MDTDDERNRTARRVLTIAGVLLAAVGAVLAVVGAVRFLSDFGDFDASSPLLAIGLFAGGGFVAVIGLALLSAGTLRARSNYAADETAPAVRVASEALSAGLRAGQDQQFCAQCGRPTTVQAKFCSACGHTLG